MNSHLFQYDPDLGYRYIPYLKTRVATPDGGYLLRTNGLGFRSDRDFEQSSNGTKRLLVFGDSFTAGDGVSNGQRYSDVLENLLQPLKVHNFGLPGSGTDQQYIAYCKFAAQADSHLVVIAVLVENIRRINSAYRIWEDGAGRPLFIAKPYFELNGDTLTRMHYPCPREPLSVKALEKEASVDMGGRYPEFRRLVRLLGIQGVVQQLTRYQPTPEYDSPDNPAWRLMSAILRNWRKLIREPVILFPIPLYQHVEQTADPRSYRERFRELAQEANFILHDPLEDLWSYDASTRRNFRFKKDIHLTPAGHLALGISLAKTIATVLADRVPTKR